MVVIKHLFTMAYVLLLFASPVEEAKNEFLEDVNRAYEYYRLESISTNDFEITVVQGIIRGEIRYGVFFFSYHAKRYELQAITNEQVVYPFSTNARGDVFALALRLDADKIYELVVQDENGNMQTLFERIYLTNMNTNDFMQQENLQTGEGRGASLTRLRTAATYEVTRLFYIVAITIVLFCGIVLLMAKQFKRGMFKEGAKTEGVFMFKEFIQETLLDEEFVADLSLGESISNPSFEEEVVSQPMVYTRYGRAEEEEFSDFNVEKHLQELGFITSYEQITEDEKNSIMIELIKLRDQKRITQDDYLKETMKLWKK